MGPRPKGHGEEAIVIRVIGDLTTLQWGHGQKAMERKRSPPGVARAQMLQWGHGQKAMESMLKGMFSPIISNSFNGATAKRPWRDRPCAAHEERGHASMGPRPKGHGEDYGLTVNGVKD